MSDKSPIVLLCLSQQSRQLMLLNSKERLRANKSEQRQPWNAVDLGGAATGCPGTVSLTPCAYFIS